MYDKMGNKIKNSQINIRLCDLRAFGFLDTFIFKPVLDIN